MNKFKASLIGLGVLVAILSVGVVKASPTLGFWDLVAEKLSDKLMTQLGAPPQQQDKIFGSVQVPPTNLVDTGTLNSQGSLFAWDTQTGGGIEVKGTAFLNGTTTYGSTSSVSPGVSDVTLTGTLATGTTTLFCQQNPFNATSTVTLSGLNIMTNPTSSAYVSYVTSTTMFPVPTTITTSTLNIITDAVVLGGSASSTPYVRAGSVQAPGVVVGNSNGSVTISPGVYVCGIVKAGSGLSGTPSLGGFTSTNSTLNGRWSARFTKVN